MTIRKEDLYDLDIVDSQELFSDGYFIYLSSVPVISTNSDTKEVIITLPSDGEDLFQKSGDHPVESLDRVYIYGTSDNLGDGYYLINSIVDNLIFTIIGNIGTSTDGYVSFMYPAGATNIGVDSTHIVGVTSNKLQTILEELSQNSTGITSSQHEKLRQLIHFINEGPAQGFTSNAFKEILPASNPFPTNIIWWVDSTKIGKIVEKIIIYNSNKTPTTITWNMYDVAGVNIIASIIDSIAYSGIFEISRTRSIS